MPKLLFIYNPNSGKGNIRKEVSLILEKLSLKGYQITVFPTAKSGDAAEMRLIIMIYWYVPVEMVHLMKLPEG